MSELFKQLWLIFPLWGRAELRVVVFRADGFPLHWFGGWSKRHKQPDLCFLTLN